MKLLNRLLLAAFIPSFLLLSSCEKEEDGVLPPVKNNARLAFIHAAPAGNWRGVNLEYAGFTLEETKRDTLNYGDFLLYKEVYPYPNTSLRSANYDKGENYYYTSAISKINLESNKAYTAVLFGYGDNAYFHPDDYNFFKIKMEHGIYEDNLNAPANGQANIRIINGTYDNSLMSAPAVDVISNGSSLANNLAYKGNTGFTGLSAGTHDIIIRKHESDTIATITGISFEAGKIYTIVFSGVIESDEPEVEETTEIKPTILVHN